MMNISNEKLGAFLDQELSDQEMDVIREAIRTDATLAERLAALASADALLQRHAAALDTRPMPDAVMAMLQPKDEAVEESPATASDNVVQLSRWQLARQQARHWINQHAALAASIALVVGFTGGQFIDAGSSGDSNGGPAATMIAINMDANVSKALDTTLSGESLTINGYTTMLSHFSFVDQQARHCRQFVLEHGSNSGIISASENIACRSDQGWQLVASAQAASANAGEYQTASGSSLLDSTLDAMMPGSPLSLAEENALIENQWQ